MALRPAKSEVSLVVLFDIDGTLIDARGAGSRALHRAFAQVLGDGVSLPRLHIAGSTDHGIFHQAATAAGRTPSARLRAELENEYRRALTEELAATGPRVLEGVEALLDWLESSESAATGLATGNLAWGAERKLAPVGLWDRFGFGGFGDHARRRTEMLDLALRRGRELAGDPSVPVVVVGDTPNDVHAARERGVPVLGVATGPYGCGELLRSGADLAVEALDGRESREFFARWLAGR